MKTNAEKAIQKGCLMGILVLAGLMVLGLHGVSFKKDTVIRVEDISTLPEGKWLVTAIINEIEHKDYQVTVVEVKEITPPSMCPPQRRWVYWAQSTQERFRYPIGSIVPKPEKDTPPH